MSDKIDDGGQAFPSHPALYSSADQAEAQGMSLRDWFAGQALIETASLISLEVPRTINVVAKLNYAIADAMLAARKGGTQ